MVGEIWAQTRNLDDRALDPVDRTMRPSDGRGRLRHPDTGTDMELRQPGSWPGGPDPAPVGRSRPAGRPDMGTDTMSDIPIRNVQLSTFNRVTERAHGGRDMGTDTEFGRPDS